MPANPKYLTYGRQRVVKVSAAILGSFFVSVSFHLMWAAWTSDRKPVWVTYSYSLFLMWCTLMLLAFLFKKGWHCWAWYGGVALVFVLFTCWGLASRLI